MIESTFLLSPHIFSIPQGFRGKARDKTAIGAHITILLRDHLVLAMFIAPIISETIYNALENKQFQTIGPIKICDRTCITSIC